MLLKELVLVKLGGSLITDKSKREHARVNVIKRLANEIHDSRKQKDFFLVVAHGGGSFPHFPAKKFRTINGFVRKDSARGFALVQDAASRLNRIVVKELISAGENAVSLPPSSWAIARNSDFEKSFLLPIKSMLEKNLLPVPFGDCVLDSEKGCTIFSTEKILSFLAKELKAKRIIIATNVDGVFTGNPNLLKKFELIPEISEKNFPEIKNLLGASYGTDVTGGMLHKVEELLKLSENGIQSSIINGEKKGNLKKALLGERTGTIIR